MNLEIVLQCGIGDSSLFGKDSIFFWIPDFLSGFCHLNDGAHTFILQSNLVAVTSFARKMVKPCMKQTTKGFNPKIV